MSPGPTDWCTIRANWRRRCGLCCSPGHDDHGGTSHDRTSRDQRVRAHRSLLLPRPPRPRPVGRDRGRHRVDRSVHRPRRRCRAPERRRQEGDHLGAVRRRRRDALPRGQRRRLRPGEARRDLQRVVHDELPGAVGQGAERPVRHRAGLQDVAQTTRKGKADLRRMRAAALSIIPSSTGAAKAIGLVLPELDGKLNGLSMRVPTPTGSITDLVTVLGGDASVDDVNEAFAAAANDASYKGVLTYSDEPLVSADIVGNPASCIFSATDTMAKGTMVKVLGWYDNEWGFSNRLVDLSAFLGER